jgi:hypothetical protein
VARTKRAAARNAAPSTSRAEARNPGADQVEAREDQRAPIQPLPADNLLQHIQKRWFRHLRLPPASTLGTGQASTDRSVRLSDFNSLLLHTPPSPLVSPIIETTAGPVSQQALKEIKIGLHRRGCGVVRFDHTSRSQV